MATSLGGFLGQGVKMPSLGQCLYLQCSYLSPETFSEVLHSLTLGQRGGDGDMAALWLLCGSAYQDVWDPFLAAFQT